ncbi:MAG: hypothetical protein RLY71_1499 [Pseudomonadota bacterium]|jgi:hypothetical protein
MTMAALRCKTGAVLLIGAAWLGCGVAAAADDAWIGQARGVATAMPPKLLKVLQDEIAQGGPENAIGVCREKAPQMARAASEQSGWQIRRVSLRNRNPKAVPDAWEQAVLADFDRRAAAGENPATLEHTEIVSDNGQQVQRYMRALPTQPLCLSCHGAPTDISVGVAAKLQVLYPHDRATGYGDGQIRGAITLKRPLP